MLKNIWKHLKEIMSRLLLILVWLIILDACTSLEDIPAILCGILSLLLFYFIHVKYQKPLNWNANRLKFEKPRCPLLLVTTAVVLILGDIFWVYHTKTSADITIDDPFDFMVLAIISFPVIEEFGFRLWLQGYLESFMNSIFAIILVAIGFGLLHKPDMPIPQVLSGILYGVVLIKTKSIWAPIMLHMLHNGILIISGNIEIIQEISFQMMDKPGNSNLYIAIIAWILSGMGIYIWGRLSSKNEPVNH